MSDGRQITCTCETLSGCCDALIREPIDQDVSEDLAVGFKALGDPHRMAVVHLLSSATGPVCVVDIERHLPLSQSTVSYHLKALVDSGVVERERKSRWSYYTIIPRRLDQLTAALAGFAERLQVPA